VLRSDDPETAHRYVILQLQHHDRASLLAGKLHAILQLPYTKGRDVYDLSCYLSHREWPAPNLTQLNNALQQTGWEKQPVTESNGPTPLAFARSPYGCGGVRRARYPR
jgi:hypothetical protein